MSIRFKFRSCQNFDSVDIDGRSSISLRELRLKIAHQKHLDTCQDFDLIFSDELSGEGRSFLFILFLLFLFYSKAFSLSLCVCVSEVCI